MKKYRLLFLAVFIFVATQHSAVASEPTTIVHRNTTDTAAGALKDNDTGWYRAEPKYGSFLVLIPVPFADATTTIIEDGKTHKIYQISGKSIEGMSFNVVEMTPKFAKAAKSLEEFAKGFSDASEYTSDINRTPFGDYASLAFYTRRASDAAFVRIVDMGDRVILMTYEYPLLYSKMAESLGSLFLSSLRLKTPKSGEPVQRIEITIPQAAGVNTPQPPTNRIWTVSDYKNITELLLAGKIALPSTTDKAGKELIARIVAPENVAFAKDKNIPLSKRVADLFEITGYVNAIGKMYYPALTRDRNKQVDAAKIFSFQLYNSADTFSLIDEFLPTIIHDEKYKVRMEGLAQVKAGATLMLTGGFMTILDNNYAQEGREVLLKALSDTLPVLKATLDNKAQGELINMLKAGIKKQDNIDTIFELTALLNELEK